MTGDEPVRPALPVAIVVVVVFGSVGLVGVALGSASGSGVAQDGDVSGGIAGDGTVPGGVDGPAEGVAPGDPPADRASMPHRAGNETVDGQRGDPSMEYHGTFDVSAATDRNYSDLRVGPVAADGQVYAVYRGNKLVGDEGRVAFYSALYALDGSTLDPAWRAEFEEASIHGRPVVVDGTAYVIMVDQTGGGSTPGAYVLHAIDAETGERRWQRDLGAISFENRLEAHGAHGGEDHPIEVDDGRVYTLTVDRGTQSVLALDAETGDVDWRFDDAVSGLHADDRHVYAGFETETDAGVVALDQSSGDRVWSYPIGDADGRPRAQVVEDGRVYAANWTQRGTDDPATLHAIEADSGDRAWTATLDTQTQITARDVFSDSGTVVATARSPDAGPKPYTVFGVGEDGTTRWTMTSPGIRESEGIDTGERTLYVRWESRFSAYAGSDLGDPDAYTWDQPYDDRNALRDLEEVNGTLYTLTTLTGARVSAYDPADGELQYDFSVSVNGGRSEFAIGDEMVYIKTYDIVRAYGPPRADDSKQTDAGAPSRQTVERTDRSDRQPAGDDDPSLPVMVIAGFLLGILTVGGVGTRLYRVSGDERR